MLTHLTKTALVTFLILLSFDSVASTTVNNVSAETADISTNSNISFPVFETNTKSVKTSILFFYTQSAVAKAGGLDELYEYIEFSVDEANDYMQRNQIAIDRDISAVIPFDGDIVENTDNLGYLTIYTRDNKEALERKYGASYYVLVVGSLPDNLAGTASVGGNVAYITPFDGGGLEYDTLAHEIGHNDGLVHSSDGTESFDTTGGFVCGEESSLMSADSSNRRENFFFFPFNSEHKQW